MIEATDYIAAPLHEHTLFDRYQLADLLLVSRAFYQLASPLFFQRIDITDRLRSLPYDQSEVFTTVCRFSESVNARHVRELVIGVRGFSQDVVIHLLYSYYRKLGEVLPKLLQAFRRLKILTIVSPELTSSITITSPVSRATANFITQVVGMVFAEYLPHVADLHPLWGHPYCRPVIYQAPMMLESLIMDWQTCVFPEAGAVIRTDGQRCFPDSHYELAFFPFVAQATNLRHLCLRYGYRRKLLLDLLDCSRLVHLEILELGGFHTSFEHLKALLSGSKHTLRAVDLQLVQLITGDWEAVFALLGAFPALHYLYVERCSYV